MEDYLLSCVVTSSLNQSCKILSIISYIVSIGSAVRHTVRHNSCSNLHFNDFMVNIPRLRKLLITHSHNFHTLLNYEVLKNQLKAPKHSSFSTNLTVLLHLSLARPALHHRLCIGYPFVNRHIFNVFVVLCGYSSLHLKMR